MLLLVVRNVLVFQWDLEDLTQLCLGELSEYQKTVKVTKRYVWQCKLIARRVHHFTAILAAGIRDVGFERKNYYFFDTLTVHTLNHTEVIYQKAQQQGLNLRLVDSETLAISLDETTTLNDVEQLLQLFDGNTTQLSFYSEQVEQNEFSAIPPSCLRHSTYLTHPVFNSYHSETQMMRYMKHLENKDYSLTHGMIPLGSCTMKLNAATEMIPITWPEFGQLHPFAPQEQSQGYQELTQSLAAMLCEITGYDAFSLQPNSGAQGEYAGLVAIQRYHEANGDGHRNVCLIPSSAHGTNPASAAMVSMKVVVVKCDHLGNIDIVDLKDKIEQHRDNLSCIMITYPSTHGVYEEGVREVCELVHQAGGAYYYGIVSQ